MKNVHDGGNSTNIVIVGVSEQLFLITSSKANPPSPPLPLYVQTISTMLV